MSGILERAAPPPALTVRYGPRPEHVIDLWLPPDQPTRGAASHQPTRGAASHQLASGAAPHEPTRGAAPLIVLIHGGFWRPAFDRAHLAPMAHALAAAGYVVAVPEYRRAGMAEEGWTGTFDDIAAALEAAGPLAEEHGADPSDLTWAGHSAGGHLALWAAARPGLPAGSRWRGPCTATHVVSLAGCNSLRLCAEWNLGAGAARNLMGGMPDEVPERYAVADPAALPSPPVPVTLVHGTADDTVPLAMSQLFGAGRLVAIPGAGHFDVIDPVSPAWPQVLAALTGIHLPA